MCESVLKREFKALNAMSCYSKLRYQFSSQSAFSYVIISIRKYIYIYIYIYIYKKMACYRMEPSNIDSLT